MASKLPSNFLAQRGPEVQVKRVDFGSDEVGLPEFAGDYAVVLDNVLSKEECDQLLAAAEDTTDGEWERAMVNTGGNNQALMTDIRNCGRIIWDDRDLVAKIWERVRGYVPEIETLENQPHITGTGPAKRKETYRMTRLNERMRFLKYSGGEYFNVHADGMYITPDNSERSFHTLHLYLNEAGPDNKLIGGATTFHGFDMNREYNVYPRTGRVLLFQHRNLWHSGQAVDGGVKYTLRTDLMFKLDTEAKA